jgi:hypothetical protein
MHVLSKEPYTQFTGDADEIVIVEAWMTKCEKGLEGFMTGESSMGQGNNSLGRKGVDRVTTHYKFVFPVKKAVSGPVSESWMITTTCPTTKKDWNIILGFKNRKQNSTYSVPQESGEIQFLLKVPMK